MKLCGTLPSCPRAKKVWTRDSAFRIQEDPKECLLRRWNVWLRDQKAFGSCAGQSVAGAIETLVGDDMRISGVSIWTNARLLQNEVENISIGTRFQYAIEAIWKRGWSDPWKEGEDEDVNEANKRDDIFDELSAYDTSVEAQSKEKDPVIIDHYYIPNRSKHRIRAIAAALEANQPVLIACGCRDAFMSLQNGTVATREHLGAKSNGHAMLLVGQRVYQSGRVEYLIRNSWGPYWGGAKVEGSNVAGLFWAEQAVIEEAWECHTLRVR